MRLLLTADQPQAPAAIDRRIAGDAFVWVGAVPTHAAMRGVWMPGDLRNPLSSVGRPGRGVYWTDGSDTLTGFTAAAGVQAADNDLTVLVVAAPTSEANFRVAFSQSSGGYFSQGHRLSFNDSGGFTPTAGSIALFSKDSGAFNRTMNVASQIDGASHAWVLSDSTALGPTCFRDGVSQAINSNSGTLFSPLSDPAHRVAVGNLYSSDFTTRFPYPMFLVVVWPRALPLALQRSLSINPWQVFAPRRTLKVRAASGGTTHNLAGDAAAAAAAAAQLAITKAMGSAATGGASAAADLLLLKSLLAAAGGQATALGDLGLAKLLAGAAAGGALAAGQLAGGATITTAPLKNNTGTVLASESGATVHVYTTAGALVVTKTGQTTNGSGVMAIVDALLNAGTNYRVVFVLASGAEGMATLAAA